MSTHEKSREYTIVWVPDDELGVRIAPGALSNYFSVVRRVVTEFFQEHTQPRGLDVQVAFALVPKSVPLFEVQVQPWIEQPGIEPLLERLKALEAPPVWNGPVMVSTVMKVGTGCTWVAAKFDLPFTKTLAPLPDGEPVDEFVMRCAAVEAARQCAPSAVLRRWLAKQVQKWLPLKWSNKLPRNSKPEPARTGSRSPLPALPNEPPEEFDVPDLAPMPLDDIDDRIRVFPDDVRHYWRRIQVWMQNQNHERIVADCHEVLRLRSDHVWTQLTLVQALRYSDDSAAALHLLNDLIQRHPRLPRAYLERSEIYAELGAVAAACQDIDHAVELWPRWPALRRWRARLRADSGKYDKALEDLDVAQRLDPYDAETYGWRAFLRRQSDTDFSPDSQNTQLSRADVELALTLDSDSVMALISRADIRIAADQSEAAIEDCNRILEHHPDSGDALAYRGLAQHRLGRFNEAVADSSLALQKRCILGFAGAVLADAQYKLGDCEAALATLDELLARCHDHVPTLFKKEALLQELDRPQEALDVLNTIIEHNPKMSQAHSERGNVHRALGKWNCALDDYATALRLGDSNPVVKLNHALTLLDLQRFEEALAEFNEGIPEMPDSEMAYFHRGRVHFALEQHDKAIADFTEVLCRNPELIEAYRLRANLRMIQVEFVAAIRDFDEIVERDPSSATYFSRAQAKILAGQLESADSDFQEAIALEPGNAEMFRMIQHLLEAQFQHGQEDYASAVESASAALELDEHCIPALRQRAASHWYGNQLVEAIDDYSAVIEQSGPSSDALSGRGQVYAELGEYELALMDLNQALEMADSNVPEQIAYPKSGRGIVLIGLKRYDEAAAAFEESIRLCPGNAWVHYHHGLMYYAQGLSKAAFLCFQLSLRLTAPPLRPRQRSRALAFLNRQECGDQLQDSQEIIRC